MYDVVLIPIDLDQGVEKAIDKALDTAESYDSELHILFVVDENIYSSYSGDEYIHEFEGLEKALEQSGREAINDVAEEAEKRSINYVESIRYGAPEKEILEYSEDIDADLIVMGSKKRPGEYRQLLGSITDKVAQTASTPLLIVKTHIDE